MKRIAIPLSMSKTQYFINQAYVDYVVAAGMKPVLIPQTEEQIELEADGLLLPGGIDLDPIYYGDDNYSSFSVEPEKDEFERILLHVALSKNIPVFGICRGFQLIAREYIQLFSNIHGISEFMEFTTHISGHNQVNDQQLSRTIHQHFVDVAPSMLYTNNPEDIGDDFKDIKRMPVNSMHHQGLLVNFRKKGVVGVGGFRMAAWTRRGVKVDPKVKDSYPLLCEAFRILDWPSRVLAVQWHPEELNDVDLLRNFFEPEENELVA